MQKKKEILPHWYLLYTNPRAEKKVEAELKIRGFEVFLPIHKTLKQWSDRKKWVEEPLFKSYIFIYTELEKYFYDILNVHGVVKFVNFEKAPAVVDPREIELVKLLLGNIEDIQSYLDSDATHLEIGEEVEVIAGPLIGTRGNLVQHRGLKQVMIELTSIHQSLLVTIPAEFIRKVPV